MKDFGKILKWNLIILFAYTILVRIMCGNPKVGSEGGLGILITLAVFVSLHILINLILSISFFSSGKTEYAKSYLLSTFLVLIIGFSSCWGAASI